MICLSRTLSPTTTAQQHARRHSGPHSVVKELGMQMETRRRRDLAESESRSRKKECERCRSAYWRPVGHPDQTELQQEAATVPEQLSRPGRQQGAVRSAQCRVVVVVVVSSSSRRLVEHSSSFVVCVKIRHGTSTQCACFAESPVITVLRRAEWEDTASQCSAGA